MSSWHDWLFLFDMHVNLDFDLGLFEEVGYHSPRKRCDIEGLYIVVVLVVGIVVVVVEDFFHLLGINVPCECVSDGVFKVFVFSSEGLLC